MAKRAYRLEPENAGETPPVTPALNRTSVRQLPAVHLGGPDVEWLTIGSAARYLGVSESTVRKWADEGRLTAFATPGGHRRFRRADLDTFLAASTTAPDEQPPLVLLVDADDERRTLVRYTLAGDGFRVHEATNADEGLAALDEEPPDLILLDVLLPDVDGCEMICKLRELHGRESIPVVMFAGAPYAPGKGGSGPRRFIGRPDPLRLVDATRQLLELQAPRQLTA
jgi:excisionase family DNA binding protein